MLDSKWEKTELHLLADGPKTEGCYLLGTPSQAFSMIVSCTWKSLLLDSPIILVLLYFQIAVKKKELFKKAFEDV